MRTYLILYLLIGFIIPILTGSCKTGTEQQRSQAVPAVKSEVELLIDYLAENGDYVNSRQFPSMIKPQLVYESLDSGTLVIDLRRPEVYRKGHIKGSVNVQFTNIPAFFVDSIKPYQYEKIILACYYGQISSYTTCLLRLMGYGNVYSMRWGMAVWNNDLSAENSWARMVSSEYESELETKENDRPGKSGFPELATGKKTGEEIFKERMNRVFTEGTSKIFTNPREVFTSRDSFFIINFERKDKYDSGHLPGAIRYKPSETLGIPSEMLTIPTDKKLLVYCGTGHNSAFATAYLRLCGYDAHSLGCGNNSFMHAKMLKEKNLLSWEAFTPDMVLELPYEKSAVR
jgi:rhodanese-related sulfurtransferase